MREMARSSLSDSFLTWITHLLCLASAYELFMLTGIIPLRGEGGVGRQDALAALCPAWAICSMNLIALLLLWRWGRKVGRFKLLYAIARRSGLFFLLLAGNVFMAAIEVVVYLRLAQEGGSEWLQEDRNFLLCLLSIVAAALFCYWTCRSACAFLDQQDGVATKLRRELYSLTYNMLDVLTSVGVLVQGFLLYLKVSNFIHTAWSLVFLPLHVILAINFLLVFSNLWQGVFKLGEGVRLWLVASIDIPFLHMELILLLLHVDYSSGGFWRFDVTLVLSLHALALTALLVFDIIAHRHAPPTAPPALHWLQPQLKSLRVVASSSFLQAKVCWASPTSWDGMKPFDHFRLERQTASAHGAFWSLVYEGDEQAAVVPSLPSGSSCSLRVWAARSSKSDWVCGPKTSFTVPML